MSFIARLDMVIEVNISGAWTVDVFEEGRIVAIFRYVDSFSQGSTDEK